MRASAVTPVIASFLLVGCVRYQPHPLDPPHSEQLFRARSLTDEGLRAFLKRPDWPPAKLQLRDLYSVALYYNPELDVARAQARTAGASIVTARTRPNPSISVGGGWTNSPESPFVFNFDPSLTLETGGKRGLRILEVEKRAEAARVEVTATAWRVLSRVRGAWLDYVMALRSVDISRDEVTTRRETLNILERRVAVGEGSRPEVETARAALLAVDVEARTAATLVNESAATLAAAVGLAALPSVDKDALPDTPAQFPLGDIQTAGLLHRADVRRSLLEYAAAEAVLHLEIAKQRPDIQLSPGYGFDEGHHKFTFGPAFEIPMFNRNQGPIAEAQARRTEAEARFNQLQASAIGEMEIALARYNGARDELTEISDRLVTIQTTRLTAARKAMDAGEGDRLALSIVRTEGAVAARARLEALRRVQGALGALDDAVQQPLEPGTILPDPEAKP